MIKKLSVGIMIGIVLCCVGCSKSKVTDTEFPTATNVPVTENPGNETAELPKGVAISEENFGDARFCDYLKEKFDTDKNGYFSDAELAEVTELWAGMRNILTPYSEMKGFSYFPALKRLQLNSAEKVEICDVPKLSEIELAGENSVQTYQLGDVTIKNCQVL